MKISLVSGTVRSLTATVARKPSTPSTASQPLPPSAESPPRRNKVRSLTTRRRVRRNVVWIQQRETLRRRRRVDGCIVSSARVLSSFLLVRPSRGSRTERKKRGGWSPKMPGSHSALFFSFSAASANWEGRKQSTHTHTHTHVRTYTHTYAYTLCRIYSKASRAFARCTKRKLSCRPEINYRVSRGWIRNVLSSTITPGVKGCREDRERLYAAVSSVVPTNSSTCRITVFNWRFSFPFSVCFLFPVHTDDVWVLTRLPAADANSRRWGYSVGMPESE